MIDISSLITSIVSVSIPNLILGDGVAPDGGGWQSGTPNEQSFVPYAVVGSNGATPADRPVDRADSDWNVDLSLRFYGGSRKQVDWAAYTLRSIVSDTKGTQFGSADPYKVAGILWRRLGGTDRNDTVSPPYWQVTDSVSLMCSRVRIARR